MSSDLETIFAELGLSQYLGTFIEQGFDEWDIILDIQESDLDALGVKLGHRRKLQRRIANARGISPSASLVTPARQTTEEAKPDGVQTEPSRTETPPEGQGVAKRKYRRHPKPDENAPERPPSAYVLFSNKIAKLVGENWQNLNASEKEAYESQANADKEKYHRDLMEYKKTADYRKYMQYLHEFKEKQAKRTQVADNSKRTKLDHARLRHSSSSSSTTMTPGNTSSGSGSERLQGSEPPPCRERLNSIASVAESQHSSTTPTLLSQANSNDDTMSSPRGNHFDAGSPREPNHQTSTRQQSWRDSLRGVELSQQQHLPSLSNMLEDGRKGMPISSGSEGNPYSTGFVAANHPRSVPEVPNVLPSAPPKIPLLRHEPSSTSSVGSVSPAASFVRTPGEGPLPIHALLSHHQTLPAPIAAANSAIFERVSPVSGFGTTTPSPTDPAPLVRPPLGHGVVPRGYGSKPLPPTGSLAGNDEYMADGDVAMTPAPDLVTPVEERPLRASLDGMSVLLRAGELVARNERDERR
ncbi:hypothetical protein FLONG3_6209 [Fusarium longipes]|uniref:HMG box domain-containing protein n=1 Tax=Fusarium longipes TaxID=694270 RepID=A0A395SMX0_9HYPO|nr:hypothetical protein FLONG3_6209 [Fusarium longipes]